MKTKRLLVLLLTLLFWVTQEPPARAQGAGGMAKVREDAEKGDARAQYFLGSILLEGMEGLPKNEEEGHQWLKKSAEGGSPAGQYMHGCILIGKSPDKKNLDPRGRQFLEKSADQGVGVAWMVLGHLEASKDKIKATAWLDFGVSRAEPYEAKQAQESLALRDELSKTLSPEDLEKAQNLSRELANRIPKYQSELAYYNDPLYAIPEGEPAFLEAEVEKLVTEVLPLVEKAASRRFQSKPKVKVAGREEVARSLEEDLLVQLEKLNPEVPHEQLVAEVRKQARAMAPALLGKYGIIDKTLYVLPKNIYPLLKLSGIDASLAPALAKILIAHELTHALQDQLIDLSLKVTTMKKADQNLAFNATIEGHAVFIQELVGTALVLDRETMEFAKFFAAGIAKSKDPLQKIQAAQFEQIYLGGLRFIRHFFDQGGQEKVWAVLLNPPTQSSMIVSPLTYSARQLEVLDLGRMMKGIETKFGDQPWVTLTQEIGRINLEAIYNEMDGNKRNELLSQIEQVQVFTVNLAPKPLNGAVSLFLMKDAAGPPDLIDALIEMGKGRLEKLEGIKDVKAGPIQDMPAKDGTVSEGSPSTYGRFLTFVVAATPVMEFTQGIYRFARGRCMVEVEDHGLGLSPGTVKNIANEVFDRYERLKGLPREAVVTRPNAVPTAGSKDLDIQKAVEFFKQNDFAKARNELRPIIGAHPSHAQGRFLLAIMAAKEKNYQKAWLNIDIACKSAPDNLKIRDFMEKLEKTAPHRNFVPRSP